MTAFVLDASSVLAWCFEDEGGPEADALIERVAAEGAAVPASWSLEIANGLVMGERRGRVKSAESAACVAMIEELPIVADRATGARALHETMGLAREHGLTACDAAYMELAMRLGLALATGDRKLGAAAERVGWSRSAARDSAGWGQRAGPARRGSAMSSGGGPRGWRGLRRGWALLCWGGVRTAKAPG